MHDTAVLDIRVYVHSFVICIISQLKEKCFVQQEQLEKLEQEMKEERFAHSECQKELNQKLKEVINLITDMCVYI